jgi:hypothetical protein
LIKWGSNINAVTQHGVPLNIAAQKEREHVISILVGARADKIRAVECAVAHGKDAENLRLLLGLSAPRATVDPVTPSSVEAGNAEEVELPIPTTDLDAELAQMPDLDDGTAFNGGARTGGSVSVPLGTPTVLDHWIKRREARLQEEAKLQEQRQGQLWRAAARPETERLEMGVRTSDNGELSQRSSHEEIVLGIEASHPSESQHDGSDQVDERDDIVQEYPTYANYTCSEEHGTAAVPCSSLHV